MLVFSLRRGAGCHSDWFIGLITNNHHLHHHQLQLQLRQSNCFNAGRLSSHSSSPLDYERENLDHFGTKNKCLQSLLGENYSTKVHQNSQQLSNCKIYHFSRNSVNRIAWLCKLQSSIIVPILKTILKDFFSVGTFCRFSWNFSKAREKYGSIKNVCSRNERKNGKLCVVRCRVWETE